MSTSPALAFSRRVVLVLLLLILAGALPSEAAAPASAQPNPDPTFTFSQFRPGTPIHLAAYGDTRFTDPSVTSGTNPRVRKWLAERIAEQRPSVLLLTGDTPYIGARAADWLEFQHETASWRASRILVLPTMGNHEVKGNAAEGVANYLRNFPQLAGHRYYSAVLGSVEVIALDCNAEKDANSPQSAWFAAQLGHIPRQVQFLFILYHIPWVADEQSQILVNLPSKDALVLRGILESHLARIRAKVVVFNGHIHNYERFERQGVEYVVTGGGGAIPYPLLFRGRADLYQDTGFPVYHYLTLDVRGGLLHAVMWKIKDPDAATLTVEAKDEFTLAVPSVKVPRKSSPAHKGSR